MENRQIASANTPSFFFFFACVFFLVPIISFSTFLALPRQAFCYRTTSSPILYLHSVCVVCIEVEFVPLSDFPCSYYFLTFYLSEQSYNVFRKSYKIVREKNVTCQDFPLYFAKVSSLSVLLCVNMMVCNCQWSVMLRFSLAAKSIKDFQLSRHKVMEKSLLYNN